ncbi:hypothetical protein [Nocardioides conyzicola]|uniref:Uncharacterized protein n=1 Tax=Nocardioides conyzicola TaxID=1651781 RepID=A0ABP8XT66_9ACTN
MRRLVLVVVSTLALLVPTGSVVAQTPDRSASHDSARAGGLHKVKRHYVTNFVFRSKKLKRCVFVEAEGNIVGQWRYAYGPDSPDKDTLEWKNIRLTNPSVKATGWPIRGKGCDSTKRWNMKADLSQGWFQSGCDLDVSVSVGFPWSVSATPEYSCDSGRVGHRTSTEGPSKKTLAQYNSGAPIHFEGTLAGVRTGGIGFRGVVSVRMHTKRASDLVRRSVNVTLNK